MADPDKVFDIETADRLSQGCGRHADPACLCDVDITRTASIQWKQGPRELLGIESSAELAQVWADYVYQNEIEGQITPILTKRTINEDTLFPDRDGGDLIKKQANWPTLMHLTDDEINVIAARMRAGESPTELARELDLHGQTMRALGKVMGTNVRNGGAPPPWRLFACNRWRDGAKVRQICDEIEREWGTRPTDTSIRSLVGHAKVTRRKRVA